MPRQRRHKQQVRIIGGKWKGRKLTVATDAIRPTPDRARVTLFNWLLADLGGARALDLFAGTGALGFEALSRGAASTTFVDIDAGACRMLGQCRERLAAAAEVHCADGVRWLRAQPAGERWDVVFLDPPYGSPLLDAALPEAAARLALHGAIYVEGDAHLDLAEAARLTGLTASRVSHAGAAHFALLRSPSGGVS